MSGHTGQTCQRRWRVRSGARSDAADLARLHIEVWEDAYRDLMPTAIFEERRAGIAEREAGWRQSLSDAATRTLVAEHESDLVGFACAGPPRDPEVGIDEELRALYVRSPWWGQGLGHSLLTSIIDDRDAYPGRCEAMSVRSASIAGTGSPKTVRPAAMNTAPSFGCFAT